MKLPVLCIVLGLTLSSVAFAVPATYPESEGAYILDRGRWVKLPANDPHITVAGGLIGGLLGPAGGAKPAGTITFGGTEPIPEVAGEDVTIVYVGAISPGTPAAKDYPALEVEPTVVDASGKRRAELQKIGLMLYGFGTARLPGRIETISDTVRLLMIGPAIHPAPGTYALACGSAVFEFKCRKPEPAPKTITIADTAPKPAAGTETSIPAGGAQNHGPESGPKDAKVAPAGDQALKPVIGVPWGSSPDVAAAALQSRGARSELQPSAAGLDEAILAASGGMFAAKPVQSWNFHYHKNQLHTVGIAYERNVHDNKAHLDYLSLRNELQKNYGIPVQIVDEEPLRLFLLYTYTIDRSRPMTDEELLQKAANRPRNDDALVASKGESEFMLGLYQHRIQPRVLWTPAGDGSRIILALTSTNSIFLTYESGAMKAKIEREKSESTKAQSNDL